MEPIEAEVHTRMGETLSVLLAGSQLPSSTSALFLETFVDISAIKKSELALQHFGQIIQSSDDAIISKTLEGLVALGVKLSLDDFGTGYASLSYLRNFRFNVLKIDRSFVMELHRNEADIKLIRAILSIARDLSLQTVAEGVESEVQDTILQELGCHIGQGYHFSRPLPAERMSEFLHQRRDA